MAGALAVQPGNVDAHYTYALVLMTVGRSAEAIGHMEAAAALDPLAPAIQSDFGRVLYRARRYDDAVARLNRALELEPDMRWLVFPRMARVYGQMGRFDQALWALDQAGEPAIPERRQSREAIRASILAMMGRRDEARRLLAKAESGAAYADTVAAYAALGDNDQAFALLFDSIDRVGPNFGAVDPPLASLHSDPRWNEFVGRVSVPRRSPPASR